MELLRFVYKNFCENKRLLIFIIMGNFLTFVLALVVPYLNGFYFNIVIYTPSKEKIIKFGCLIVGLGGITTMLTYCFNIYKTKVQSQLVFKTMNEIIRCVQYSDYSESSKFNPSYLHQKINIDANKIWSFVFDNIISSVFQSLTIIGVIIAIGKINKKIFLLIMFIVPAYILSYYYLKKPLYEQSTRYKEEQSAYYKHINEQFEFIKKIKLWADYKNKENKRRREFGKYLEEFMKYTKLSYFYNSLESIITLVFKSTALIVGGIEMISGNLTLGEFLIISSYFGMLIQSIKFFFSFGQVYQDAKNSFDWITKIKNLEKEQYGTKIVNQKINRVKISRLEFSYDNKKILTNYNEEFMEGINLIMGANGSGKSTLLYLLCGLLHTKKKGNIEFNNIPISEVEIESLRKNKISIYIQNQNEMDITVKEMLAERFDIGALEILIKQYHLEELHTKLESMSFNNKIELRVQPLMPLGRGNKNLENICPTDIQYRKLVNTINTINARNPSIKIVWGDPVDHLIRFPEHTELPMYYISIRANGDIVTSPYLPLVVGNIRNHSIEEYWNGGLYELWKKKIPCYMAAFIKSVGDMGRITEKFPATFMDDIYIDMLEKDLDDLSLLPNN